MMCVRRGFTLIEVLVVAAATGLLLGAVVAAAGDVRGTNRDAICRQHLSQLAKGWAAYADDHHGVLVPGRFAEKPGGSKNPANHYDVGNGKKFRPRWAAGIGKYVGVYAFNQPSTSDDRQNYDAEVFICPEVGDWKDERNAAYGYNHQFLGNGRQTGGRYHNFPVVLRNIKNAKDTVVAADSMGTAAAYAEGVREPYNDDGRGLRELGNHGWSLDPPRLTEEGDRGTGEEDSPRTAVDPRHHGKVGVVFADGHASDMNPVALGFRTDGDGRFVDYLDGLNGRKVYATNRYFTGTGRDGETPVRPVSTPE